MRSIVFFLMLTCGWAGAQQVEGGRFTQKNTFTVFGEYSNDSSHIILGVTPNRKLAGIEQVRV